MIEQSFEIGNDGPSVILVGIDGSPSSIRARSYAVGWARRQHARLIAVHVRPVISAGDLVPEAAAVNRQCRDDLVDHLCRDIDATAAYDGQQIEFWLRDGDPFSHLLSVAAQVSADALVVGASTQVRHRLIGSLASRLVRSRRLPVTVVP